MDEDRPRLGVGGIFTLAISSHREPPRGHQHFAGRRAAGSPGYYDGVFVLAAIFLAAAVAKISTFSEFTASLLASRLIPPRLVDTTAGAIIALEGCVAILLCVPSTRQVALHAGAAISSIFLAYSAWRAVQGIPIPCHCFGRLFTMSPWQGMALNAILLAGFAWLILADRKTTDRLPALERSAS